MDEFEIPLAENFATHQRSGNIIPSAPNARMESHLAQKETSHISKELRARVALQTFLSKC